MRVDPGATTRPGATGGGDAGTCGGDAGGRAVTRGMAIGGSRGFALIGGGSGRFDAAAGGSAGSFGVVIIDVADDGISALRCAGRGIAGRGDERGGGVRGA